MTLNAQNAGKKRHDLKEKEERINESKTKKNHFLPILISYQINLAIAQSHLQRSLEKFRFHVNL